MAGEGEGANLVAMFVYLDESGDAGFKFHLNSSRFFVITLLLVDDPIPIHVAIDKLRRDLGFRPGNEFKFMKSRLAVRLAFLEMLSHQNFAARALVIDKTLVAQPQLRRRESFYNRLVEEVLAVDDGAITDAVLVLDESVTSRQYKKQFASYLRGALNKNPNLPKVRDIRFHASHSDNLIQAADMIAGAIYAAYHRGNPAYLDLLRSKVQIQVRNF